MKKILKKLTVAMLSVATIVGATAFSTQNTYANTNEIKVIVDGEYVDFDVAPINDNGRVFVPMRAIFEALGFEVSWDNVMQFVVAHNIQDNYVITNIINTEYNAMFVNYKEHKKADENVEYNLSAHGIDIPKEDISIEFMNRNMKLEQGVKNINGRILVPVRVIAEGSGANVDWDSSTRTVIIDSSNKVITNIETGISYDVNGAKARVDSYFASGGNDASNDNTNNQGDTSNNNNTGNNTNNTTVDVNTSKEPTEAERKAKELEIVRFVNEERVKAGLNELEIRDDLMYVARWHAEEKAELNYFSHMSPTYNLEHTELARVLGADYTFVGENATAGSYTPARAMHNWMNSEPHKRGILNPNFKYIGVGYGYSNDADYVSYWSLYMGY